MANTVSRKGNEVLVTITETSVSSSTEETITLGFQKGRIVRQQCTLASGSGATVDPILASSSGGTGNDIIVENGTAAGVVDNQSAGIPFYSSTGIVYHKSVPNTGSDNAVNSVYMILVGWE
jgi:hypothetical protein